MNTDNQTRLIQYAFGDTEIRTAFKDGEVWFVATDICKALELSNPSIAIQSLDEDETLTLSLSKGQKKGRGGAQSFNIVNESGLYHLIFKSRKPSAKIFRKWVTGEVLPALRKYGSYSIPQDQSQARLEGKHARRVETDAISKLIEYAKEQGSSNADRYYMSITNMVYNLLLGIKHGKHKPNGLRDSLNTRQLTFLSSAEYVVAAALDEGVALEMPYKQIYQHAKLRLQLYVDSVGNVPMLGIAPNVFLTNTLASNQGDLQPQAISCHG